MLSSLLPDRLSLPSRRGTPSPAMPTSTHEPIAPVDAGSIVCGRDCPLNTIDVYDLDFQTNIYSLCGLEHPALTYPVVFIATCAQVYCLLKSEDAIPGPPSMQVLPLREVPSQHRIMAIDVFPHEGNVVLGLTFIPEAPQADNEKGRAGSKGANLKATLSPGQFHIYVFSAAYLRENILDTLQAIRWQRFELNYTPLKLLHYRTYEAEGKMDHLFILAGSDRKLHYYYHELDYTYWDSTELQIEDSLFLGALLPLPTNPQKAPSPGAPCLPSNLLCIDVFMTPGAFLMAMGGQDGYVYLCVIPSTKSMGTSGTCTWDGEDGGQAHRHSLWLNGPIAAIQLFTFKAEGHDCHPLVAGLKQRAEEKATVPHGDMGEAVDQSQRDRSVTLTDISEISVFQDEIVNLLVAEAMGRVFVFVDIVANGLNALLMLPDSLPANSPVAPTAAREFTAHDFQPGITADSPCEMETLDSQRASLPEGHGGSFGIGRRTPGLKEKGKGKERARDTKSAEMADLVNAYFAEVALEQQGACSNAGHLESGTTQAQQIHSATEPSETEQKDMRRQASDLFSCDSKLRKSSLKARHSFVPSECSVLQQGVTCAMACNLCSCGVNHILVGTWDNRLVCYAPIEVKGPRADLEDGTCRMLDLGKTCIGYQLTSCVEYHHPLYGFYEADINRDGVQEVVVCGQFECYVLQPKPKDMRCRLNDILHLMNDILLLEDELSTFDPEEIMF